MKIELSDEQRAAFYTSHRDRSATSFKKKHLVQYDREFAALTGATPGQSVLEIGCGTGLFLRYLEARGYREIVGLDMDKGLAAALGDLKTAEVHLDDVTQVLDGKLAGRTFDHIVLLDVAEHLQMDVLVALMERLKGHMSPVGTLTVRVPNIESPWGLKMFFGSFDHVTPLGPGRLKELGMLTGWDCQGVYAQEPLRLDRRIKERLLNGLMALLLSYRPDVWTANVIAVYTPVR